MTTGRLLWVLMHAGIRAVGSLALVLATAAAVLWVWSGTQASLDWAWRHYAQPRGLEAQGLSGSLREGLRAQRLQARVGDLTLDLRDTAIEWDLLSWLDHSLRLRGQQGATLRIGALRVAHLQVQQAPPASGAPSKPRARPPIHLALPIALHVDQLAIERLTGPTPRLPPVHAIAGRYHYHRANGEHQLTLIRASAANGRYDGWMRLGDRPPFSVQGGLQGQLQTQPLPGGPPSHLRVDACANGTLENLGLRLDVRTGRMEGRTGIDSDPLATLTARLTPWRAPFLVQGHARLRHLNLAALWPTGVHTDLQGVLALTPEGVSGWRLQTDLDNALPGPWDQRRLPLTRLQGHGEWRDGIARVRRLRAELGAQGEAGHLEASGQWQAARGWHLNLRLDRVRSEALHRALAVGTLSARWGGALQARAQAGATRWDLRLRGEASAPASRHLIQVELAALAEHAAGNDPVWRGRVDALRVVYPDPSLPAQNWTLHLQQPVRVRRDAQARWSIDAGHLRVAAPAHRAPVQAHLIWDPMHWGGGEFQGAGRLRGLPLSWLTRSGQPLVQGDMVFDAQWDARLAQTLRLSAQLTRVQGDIRLLAEAADGAPTRVPAGVREARLTLESVDDVVRMELRWASERAGHIEGHLTTRLVRGGRAGWYWPADAALAGQVQARLPRIAAWSLLAPPSWRVRGALAADIDIGGTRAAPRLSGPVRADDLTLRSVVDGVALQAGRLRAHLEDHQVQIDELTWQTPDGGGTLRASGRAGWVSAQPGRPSGLFAQLDARLERLRASVRSDRQLVVSGVLSTRLDPTELAVQGDLQVDHARITVPDLPTPALGDDVVVHNLPSGVPASAGPAPTPPLRAVRLAINLDLGRDMRVSGRGLDTGLQGQVRLTGDSFAQPRVVGTVSAVDGRYRAYGQRLTVLRGVLRFTGPLNDPAVDALAVRPDLDPPVGVQVTGRAQAPVVRLWSQAPATDAQKLSSLVLGRTAAASGAETVLLEQAALSLLGRRAGLGSGGIAAAFGLDELTLRREADQGAALTLGKRLGRRLYAAYERSLSGAMGTLYVFYDLGTRLTLRAQAGDRAGVDLIYALSFDHAGGSKPAPDARPSPRAPTSPAR